MEFEVTLNEVDAERRHKLTKTLAWLHSRGKYFFFITDLSILTLSQVFKA